MSAKPEYSANQTVTISLNSLADGSGVSSSEIDNSIDLFLDEDLEINLKGSNASESGKVVIYIQRGNATGNLEDVNNATRLTGVYLNGTAAVRKVLRVKDLPKFYELRAVHVSSGGYALDPSGNSMAFLGINIQDV
jgi:hypothetical protein